jgi:hypothetical protein
MAFYVAVWTPGPVLVYGSTAVKTVTYEVTVEDSFLCCAVMSDKLCSFLQLHDLILEWCVVK